MKNGNTKFSKILERQSDVHSNRRQTLKSHEKFIEIKTSFSGFLFSFLVFEFRIIYGKDLLPVPS